METFETVKLFWRFFLTATSKFVAPFLVETLISNDILTLNQPFERKNGPLCSLTPLM